MRTIIRMLEEASSRYPSRSYASMKKAGGWEGTTFSEVDKLSDFFAAFLLDKKIKSASNFGLLAEGRTEWIVAEMGLLKARMVSVPLSIKLTSEEIAFRLKHSEAKGIIASSNTLDNICKALETLEEKPLLIYLDEADERLERNSTQFNWIEGQDYVIWSKIIAEGEQLPPSLVKKSVAKIDEHDVINICYTSGTTGNPKGIMLTHLNYWSNSHDAVALFELPDAELETLVVLPVDHSFAHTVAIYTALLKGITLHFVDARGSNAAIVRNFPKNLTEVNPTFLLTVPSISGNFMKKMVSGIKQKGPFIDGIFNRGLNAGIKRNGDGYNKPSWAVHLKTFIPYKIAALLVFPKLREVFGNRIDFCVGGGALLEARQQHFFGAIGVPVYQGYGLTEAAPIISSNSPKKYKFGTSGVVAPSVTCKIMVDDTTEAVVGQRGEIVIKGENVMKGYFNNPEATKEVLREENGETWLWTGDLGYFDEDGFLVVTGRAKALLIAKDGEKYSPEEVEEVIINNVDIINQLVVYNDHKPITVALVTLHEDLIKSIIEREGLKDEKELLKSLEATLRSYEEFAKESIPSQWIPSRFALIPKAFSEADGLVNSTMKLVRYKIAEAYKERLEQIYESEELNEQLNREALKGVFFS
ncbi:MAG: AMP-binding protein [Sphaerochaetaceae bacterium]